MTKSDMTINLSESTIPELFLEYKGGVNFPPVKINYNSQVFGVQIIPEDEWNGSHSSYRISMTRKGREATKRLIDFAEPRRGIISVYMNDNKKFKSGDLMTNDVFDAAAGFVLFNIDNIEMYSDGTINREEFMDSVDVYNDLSQKEKEKWAKLAKKKGST